MYYCVGGACSELGHPGEGEGAGGQDGHHRLCWEHPHNWASDSCLSHQNLEQQFCLRFIYLLQSLYSHIEQVKITKCYSVYFQYGSTFKHTFNL